VQEQLADFRSGTRPVLKKMKARLDKLCPEDEDARCTISRVSSNPATGAPAPGYCFGSA
jgi:hypothetical protein